MGLSPRAKASLIVIALSALVLGLLWAAVFVSLRSQDQAVDVATIQAPVPPSTSLVLPPSGSPPPEVAPSPASPTPQPREAPALPPMLTGEGPDTALAMGPRCRAELEKMCEGIQPGGGRRRKCFEDHLGKLSPGCQEQIQQRTARLSHALQQVKLQCEGDIKQYCRVVQGSGGGRLVQCLKEHYKHVSDRCYQALVDLL